MEAAWLAKRTTPTGDTKPHRLGVVSHLLALQHVDVTAKIRDHMGQAPYRRCHRGAESGAGVLGSGDEAEPDNRARLDAEHARGLGEKGFLFPGEDCFGAVGQRHGGGGDRTASTVDGEDDLVPGAGAQVSADLAPGLEVMAIYGQDPVTGFQARQFGRALAGDEAVDGGYRVVRRRVGDEVPDIARAHEKDHQHPERQEEVHERPGEGNRQAPPSGLVAVGAWLVGRVDLLGTGHAHDAAITSEG